MFTRCWLARDVAVGIPNPVSPAARNKNNSCRCQPASQPHLEDSISYNTLGIMDQPTSHPCIMLRWHSISQAEPSLILPPRGIWPSLTGQSPGQWPPGLLVISQFRASRPLIHALCRGSMSWLLSTISGTVISAGRRTSHMHEERITTKRERKNPKKKPGGPIRWMCCNAPSPVCLLRLTAFIHQHHIPLLKTPI